MNPRLPVDVIEGRNRSHLTKAEIDERRELELKPVDMSIEPPKWLTTKAQKDEFVHKASALVELGIWDSLDTDELARYVLLSEAHANVTHQLRRAIKAGDLDLMKSLMAIEKELYRQVHELASSFGLNVTSRARIAVPPRIKQENEPDY